MQKQGAVQYLTDHKRAVKSVSFNPVDRYIFCSGSSDGQLIIYGSYDTLTHYRLISYTLTASRENCKEINGVKFTSDGSKVMCGLSNKKMAIVDVETGQITQCYDDCCFSGTSRDSGRMPIITDKNSPFLAISPYQSNKGITLYDVRMPLPFDFLDKIHENGELRDLVFIDNSWPFVPKNEQGIACLFNDGVCKVVALNNRLLHQFEVGHKANAIVRTPGSFDQMAKSGFSSKIMIAGDQVLSTYSPDTAYEKIVTRALSTNFGIQEYLNHFHRGLTIQPFPVQVAPPTLSNYSHLQHSSSNNANNANHHHHLTTSSVMHSSPILLAQSAHRRTGSLIKKISIENSISQLKYGTNGGFLYAVSNSNQKHVVQRFRRYPNEHRLVDELYSHKGEIYDMDISPYDEFLVTASRDRTVAVICLGSPNHGTTSVSQLT